VKETDVQGLGLDEPNSATGYNSLFYESTWRRKQNCCPIRSDVDKMFLGRWVFKILFEKTLRMTTSCRVVCS